MKDTHSNRPISTDLPTSSNILTLALAVFLSLLFLWLWLSSNTYLTWDEPVYAVASENAAQWLGLIARGKFADAADPYNFGVGWGLNNETTPLIRILNGVAWLFVRTWLPVPLQHRVGTIVLAAALVSVMTALTARWRGKREALFTALSIATLPRLVFHAQLGTTDFALAATWGVATLIFFQQMSVDRSRIARSSCVRIIRKSLVIGTWAAIAVLAKINAVLLAPFWGLWMLLFRRDWLNFMQLALAAPIALLLIYVCWPWIWKDPFTAIPAFLREYSNHPAINQWFAGELYVETPWFVPLGVFLTTTPVLFLLLAVFAVVTHAKQRPTEASAADVTDVNRATSAWMGLHLIGMALILLYFVLPMNNLHDQDRMLSPAYIHLAFLSGMGFDRLWCWLHRRFSPQFSNRTARSSQLAKARSIVLQIALAAVLIAPGAVAIARLHPFQLAYYNEFVGGPVGARKMDMETIYFASTYGHFLPALNDLPPGTKLWVMPNSWNVLYYYQQHGFLQPDLVLLRPPGWGSFYDDQNVPYEVGFLQDADYALIERRQTALNDKTPEGALQVTWVTTKPVVSQLEKAGVVLAGLYANRTP